MVTFGKTAAEEAAERIARTGTFYIKTFRDDETKVRFLAEAGEFIAYGDHFKEFDQKTKRSFPCAIQSAGLDICIGCNDPDPEVSKINSKWALPVLDERDYVQVYKIGVNFFKHLRDVWTKQYGTIVDRDYAVLRTGKAWNEITYTAVPLGEPYDRRPSISLPNIQDLLGGQYAEVSELYGYTPEESGADPQPMGQPDESVPDPEPADENVVAGVDFSTMTSDMIKDWLKPRGVVPDERAQRSQLLKLAKAQLEKEAKEGAAPASEEPPF